MCTFWFAFSLYLILVSEHSNLLMVVCFLSLYSIEPVVLWDAWENCKSGAWHLFLMSTSGLQLLKLEFQIKGLWSCLMCLAWSICQCHFHARGGKQPSSIKRLFLYLMEENPLGPTLRINRKRWWVLGMHFSGLFSSLGIKNIYI